MISFGDFLENNAKLIPSGYVEEFWIEELKKIIKEKNFQDEYITQFLEKTPTFDEKLEISLKFKITLHPKYLY